MNHVRRLAIVNRGAAAIRALTAVADLNQRGDAPGTERITTVAVHVDDDADAWFVREADEAICLGSATYVDPADGRRRSRYLDERALVEALIAADVDAVWAGWGFVADRASFVQRCEHAGLHFVGPGSATIRLLGDTVTAKRMAEKADVPVVPWSGRTVDDVAQAVEDADRLGYPVVIKAASGGDSRPIRVLQGPDELPAAITAARNEAELAFGDPAVFLEAHVEAARHVEVQVVADDHGTVWALGLRDCSVQRGNRTLLDESAATGLDPATEAELRAAAVRLTATTGYRNAGTVEFLVDPVTQQFQFMQVNTRLQVDHPVTEATTGVDLVALQLHLACGGRLAAVPPPAQGHAVTARLCAEDPEREFLVAPGTLTRLRLPSGPGIRVDAGMREGDEIRPDIDPLIATVTAWGADRAEALARLRRALAQTTVVVEGGATNRSLLLTVLDRPELRSGEVDNRWLDQLVADREHVAPPDRVALLMAAIEAYEIDHAGTEAAFHVTATRGRPEMPTEVGSRVQLRYRGVDYHLDVYRTSPGTYRVACGSVAADLAVQRLDEYERRVVCGGTRHHVLAVAQGAGFRIEVDDRAHEVTREDGSIVRAGWPAFVVSVLVAPGDQVEANTPVAVLESMKMATTVLAPFAGEVASVAVVPNAQVTAGAPLVRIRSAGGVAADASQPAVDLSGLVARAAEGTPPCERVFGALRNYLLGYDLDAAGLRRLFVEQRRLGEIAPPADAGLLACEDALLDLFAEVGALYRPRSEARPGDAASVTSSQEYLHAFLQWRDVERTGLPADFVARLRGGLARYGVRSLDPSAELDAALVWMFRSFARVIELVPVVMSVLTRRQRASGALAPVVGEDMRRRLDRLVVATEGRHQTVAELARDVRFHYFDEPVLESLLAKGYLETTEALDRLAADPEGPQRRARIDAVVDCPQPMRSDLLRYWVASTDDAFRRVLLEIYTRRFYRTRELRDVRFVVHDGRLMCVADYEWGNKQMHLVVGYAGEEHLPRLLGAAATHIAGVDADRDVVLDVSTWRAAEQAEEEVTADALLALLTATEFVSAPWRVDFTVTSTGGDGPEHLRTQHMTYRRREDGTFWEELLYRNLHPMLAKRLDLWRLADFRLERLPSAEDVYLFHGVANENPKDHRLFALAEVRDLTVVPDDTGAPTYPWLERTALQAVAALRQARRGFGPRERPVANRIVLFVRPTWTLRRDSWPAVAGSLAPLAEGAALEKVVLSVRIPEADGTLRNSFLHVEGMSGRGVTVTELPPSNEPVRPLSPYRQKVLVAERFGVPYPYEIIRMLAAESGMSTDFPGGSFVEYDLGPDDVLEPIDREPGCNVANVVVGLITTTTDTVPEGMTRVALLSDPTRGLGNLAEPECRRILAALDLAERLKVPVEWYAVSSGALIAMDSGTENMDWIADVLRGLIEFTQRGGEVNVVVTGINVGGQPYWNAEATMLMHTKGILIMTPASAMVLTGKQALDFSGGVSADDQFGIGGYDRVMGINGQAQYWAPTFEDACRVLLRHYDHTYVVPGERFPRRAVTKDAVDRDVCGSPHEQVPGSDLRVVGDIFSETRNPERKSPFDIRSVMRAVCDTDAEPLERWERWRGAETSVVWDARIGGIPVCLLGLESRTLLRRGFVPADGPTSYTAGTLFPQSSRKTARAINAATGNRPLVVLANLSGFDGSPESMRHTQLEYGAEIGRAVTNFDGPIVFVVISRYHGGAFVVFSKKLNEAMEIVAIEGSYASVIGGAPAAATVFARDVKARTAADPRVESLNARIVAASGSEASTLRAQLAQVLEQVRSEKLGEVAAEFDAVHTIERARSVGSVDRIIPAAQLRPYVVDALERGMARTLQEPPG
jgi:acetyl/propionyl-CoA carboxylase alpha subunit/acetyl-CoA carboxylase carboxyltransferase component